MAGTKTFSFDPASKDLNVRVLTGAILLTDEQLMACIAEVCQKLKGEHERNLSYVSKVVTVGPYAAALIATPDGWDMLIGFGLEVIQAVQNSGKNDGNVQVQED